MAGRPEGAGPGGFFHALFIAACVLFPSVAMRLMWRRMKRLRDQAYRSNRPAHHETRWQETVATEDGLKIARAHEANDGLIELGGRARHSNGPISNP